MSKRVRSKARTEKELGGIIRKRSSIGVSGEGTPTVRKKGRNGTKGFYLLEVI